MKQNQKCPNCDSEEITVEGRGIHPNFAFNKDDEITALKFDNSQDLSMLEIKCQSCDTELKATKEGYRIAHQVS